MFAASVEPSTATPAIAATPIRVLRFFFFAADFFPEVYSGSILSICIALLISIGGRLN
jgi:hypothetical protein